MIVGVIGGTEFEDLALAIAEWKLSESYDLLKKLLLCFRLRNGPKECVTRLNSFNFLMNKLSEEKLLSAMDYAL